MNDYTKALHQRFYREPENTEEELEPYSFDYDQEERARQKIELEVD